MAIFGLLEATASEVWYRRASTCRVAGVENGAKREVRDVDDRRHCAHLRATEFAANDMMTDVLESDEKSAVNVVLVCPGDNESQWSAALVSFRLG